MKLCGREKCASKKGLISFHSKSKFPRVFLADNFKVLKNLSNLDNNEDRKDNSAFLFINLQLTVASSRPVCRPQTFRHQPNRLSERSGADVQPCHHLFQAYALCSVWSKICSDYFNKKGINKHNRQFYRQISAEISWSKFRASMPNLLVFYAIPLRFFCSNGFVLSIRPVFRS